MTVRIFISGPVRPSQDSVRRVILTIRAAFPDAITYLFTWKSETDTSKIREEVDHYIEEEEQDTEEILKRLKNSPRYVNGSKWPAHAYKMMYGVTKLCKYANPDDNDIIVRIRTDSIFIFKTTECIRNSLELANIGYVSWPSASSGSEIFFNDWFGIAKYSYFKKGWYISSIKDFDMMYSMKNNPEHVVKNNLVESGIYIFPLDMRYVECYLLREKDGVIIDEYH